MKVRTIDFTSGILKSLDKSDIIESKVLDSEIDTQADIIEPPAGMKMEGLKRLRNYSIWHRKCLKAVAMDVTMRGWKPISLTDKADEDNKTALEDLFNDYNNSRALFKVMQDFRTYPHAAFEINTNSEGMLKGFSHIRATTIRMCKGGETAVQRIGSSTRYFKVYGNIKSDHIDMDLNEDNGKWGIAGLNFDKSKTANSIVWLTDGGEDSDYYHEPEYIPSVQVILSDDYLRGYNVNGLKTNGVPNYLIMFAGDFEEKDETDEDEDGIPDTKTFDEDLEDSFKNTPARPGTAIVFPVKTTGKDAGMIIEVHKLSEPLKEGSYTTLNETNMIEILAAHEVPAARLGITKDGPLGGSVDYERNKQYNDNVIKPLQNFLDNILNQLIYDLLDVTDWKHEFKGLDLRNIKEEFDIACTATDKGAMKPIELREVITDLFKLDNYPEGTAIITYYPELDEFYMNGYQIGSNQANQDDPEEMEAIIKSLENFKSEAVEVLEHELILKGSDTDGRLFNLLQRIKAKHDS